MKRIVLLAFVAVTATASSAFAGPWSPAAGSQPTFDYSSGSDLNNYFGTPLTFTNGFNFVPAGMTASAVNDSSASVADTTSVIMTAAPNRYFSWISAGFMGDYSILGNGSVNGIGEVRVRNLDTMQVLTQTLTFTPDMPVGSGFMDESEEEEGFASASGLFQSNGVIVLPFGWRNVQVELDGLVSAYGGLQSASLIQGKSGHINVGTEVIPLPPAVLAAIPVIALAGWARKRMSPRRA